MANHYKNKVRRNYLGNARIILTDHTIERFIERQGYEINEIDFDLLRLEIIRKFKNTKLRKFFPGNKELRYEVAGSLNERMQFIAEKTGVNTFRIVTCMLQGKKNDWWKNEGLVKHA